MYANTSEDAAGEDGLAGFVRWLLELAIPCAMEPVLLGISSLGQYVMVPAEFGTLLPERSLTEFTR